MFEQQLFLTNSGADDIGEWKEMDITPFESPTPIVDAIFFLRKPMHPSTVGDLFIIGGWTSNSFSKRGTIHALEKDKWTLKLTDNLRIYDQLVPVPNIVGYSGSSLEWLASRPALDRITTYSGSSIGVSSTVSSNHFLGGLALGRLGTNGHLFQCAGTTGDSRLARLDRSNPATISYISAEFPNHGGYPKVVVTDDNNAYVVGGGLESAATGLLTTFKCSTDPVITAKALAPMPHPACRGIAYLEDQNTIVHIGGNRGGHNLESGLIIDDVSDMIQKYDISKNEWTVMDERFPVKIVGACFSEDGDFRYLGYGAGVPGDTSKIYKMRKK